MPQTSCTSLFEQQTLMSPCWIWTQRQKNKTKTPLAKCVRIQTACYGRALVFCNVLGEGQLPHPPSLFCHPVFFYVKRLEHSRRWTVSNWFVCEGEASHPGYHNTILPLFVTPPPRSPRGSWSGAERLLRWLKKGWYFNSNWISWFFEQSMTFTCKKLLPPRSPPSPIYLDQEVGDNKPHWKALFLANWYLNNLQSRLALFYELSANRAMRFYK